MILRAAFARMRDSEVRFGIGLLDDFSRQWGELPDILKQKWRDIAKTVREGLPVQDDTRYGREFGR